MSKSGNYNLGEIEKRDALIQELAAELMFWVPKEEPYVFAEHQKLIEARDRWHKSNAVLAKLQEDL